MACRPEKMRTKTNGVPPHHGSGNVHPPVQFGFKRAGRGGEAFPGMLDQLKGCTFSADRASGVARCLQADNEGVNLGRDDVAGSGMIRAIILVVR